MFFRVYEMKEKLLYICEQRMLEAERERIGLINTMWPPKHMLQYVNNKISAFQLELDRFVDSILLVNDFYTGIITNMPNPETLTKENLTKLSLEDSAIQEEVNKLLEYVPIGEEEEDKNPFTAKIDQITNKCSLILDKDFRVVLDIMKKTKSIFDPKPDKKKKKGKKGMRLNIISCSKYIVILCVPFLLPLRGILVITEARGMKLLQYRFKNTCLHF